ncbi:FAD-dependent oxidoreductase [Patescibacteria group bacterium]|nr:FAD-dependent oxidoreductase [Patescibacteria group bacterium]
MNILIIGGGFVGITAARNLQKKFGKTARITVVSSSDRFLFTPRLIDVLGSNIDALATYSVAIDTIARRDGFAFLHADVLEIHRDKKEVTCKHLPSGVQTILAYDTLVISPGAQTSWFGIPGAQAHSIGLKTMEDVTAIHECIDTLLDEKNTINVCVVGAGPTGIEGIFAVRQYIEQQQKARATSIPCTYTLIQGAPQILPGFPLQIVKSIVRDCSAQQINVIVNEPVTQITQDYLVTTHHPKIPADLTIWAGGLQPNLIPIVPPVQLNSAGWLMVDHNLSVAPNIFAAGDSTAYLERNVTVPKNAQTAMLMSQTLCENIMRLHHNKPLRPFHYQSKGNILVIGKTGYIDAKLFCIRTTAAPLIRDLLYRFRQYQITG